MRFEGRLVGWRMAAFALAAIACAAPGAWGNGTEILGPPDIPIAAGTGFALGGVGLMDVPQPADIVVTVPADAQVKQVLLYWVSEHYPQSGPDTTALINGVPVTGTVIGGATNFFSVVYFATLRVDITDLGLVVPGTNTLQVSGLASSFRTTGAGVLVIYDTGVPGYFTELLDGQDLAYWRLVPPLDTTVPLYFFFEPADVDRVATVPLIVGSVGDLRPNVTEVIVGETSQLVYNLFTSLDGPQWDTQTLEVTVPAGVDKISIQLLSAGDGSGNNPASMTWVAAGIAIQTPQEPPEECLPCDGKVTELTLQYLGSEPDAFIEVVSKLKHQAPIFAGTVQPGELFTLFGNDKQGTLGPEIVVYVNGVKNASIHTSCSQPIGPGLVRGDFLVIDGYSRNGGLLCPVEDQGDPDDGGCGDDDDDDHDGCGKQGRDGDDHDHDGRGGCGDDDDDDDDGRGGCGDDDRGKGKDKGKGKK